MCEQNLADGSLFFSECKRVRWHKKVKLWTIIPWSSQLGSHLSRGRVEAMASDIVVASRAPIVASGASIMASMASKMAIMGSRVVSPLGCNVTRGSVQVRGTHRRSFKRDHLSCYIKWTQFIWTKGYRDYPSSGRLVFYSPYHACLTQPFYIVLQLLNP